ncbi:helix-turn-helix domain-containing protein [Streptomyces goshikiensis]|uniref:helix-turn-helix domain-containing protein n=1 Tax=Streptomyces goshikiensis TaxID=1942 RepID=UPI0036B4A5BE
MGRPELPVDCTVAERGHLASLLRGLRMRAGLTYDELALKTGLSPATLKRAASGRVVPSWATVEAVGAVCGDELPLKVMWEAARAVERGRLRGLRRPGAPELITSRGALSEALEYFYERAGAVSLRRLQERAGGPHLLPVSTAARIVNRETLPASRQQCFAFLIACGLAARVAERWAAAYERVMAPPVTPVGASRDLEAALAILLSDEGVSVHGPRPVNRDGKILVRHLRSDPVGRQFTQRMLSRRAGGGQGEREPRAA